MAPRRSITPIALEVTHNRRSLCTAGMRGKPGVLTAILHWVNREPRDEIELSVAGRDSATGEDLTWAKKPLRVGDEIVIRVVESAKVSRPKRRQKALTRESVEKHEKAYLARTAKKYGYKLVKA